MAWPAKAEHLSTRGWRLALAGLSGIVASASLPPLNLTVAICALSLSAMAMASARRGRDAFLLGWATGFGWFLFSLSWISVAFITSGGGHVFLIPFAAVGLPLLLGIFWAVGYALAWRASQYQPGRVLMLIAVLSVMEYARGRVFSGFPWNAPGYLFAAHVTLLQGQPCWPLRAELSRHCLGLCPGPLDGRTTQACDRIVSDPATGSRLWGGSSGHDANTGR